MVERINEVYKDVDFCITYFMRRKGLDRLIKSIRKHYPRADITIANQSKETLDHLRDVTILNLPFDFGVSGCRNYLVKNTTKPYLLLLEEDFIFNDRTDIKILKELLQVEKNVGVVGGLVKENGQDINFEQYFTIKGRTLEHIHDGDFYLKYRNIPYKETGSVLNFALFKREVFRDIAWDEELKLAEHTDFYYRLQKMKWKVLYTNYIYLDTLKDVNTKEYKVFKTRDDFKKKLFDKYDIDTIEYANGYQVKYDRINNIIIKGRNL